METPKIVKVSNDNLVSVVEALAHSIWREYFVPLIGSPQVEYMLEKFQSRQALLNQIEKQGCLYYLLEDKNGNRVGYFAIVPHLKELFLSKLYVTAKNRRKGYGRGALEFIETLAKNNGFSKVILTVNKNNASSINAYKKLGFVITNSLVTDIGDGFAMDDYKMEKVI
ncbi:MAG: GNAT family N-acetyltransferase [Phycisphaerae bacterium]|nr:GNAT family N-acetyltransferase [Phycisphaerae bacterium]MDD5381541.1 GNAT family N-acetyltransferase [Phycisphaerae bacterium]